MQNYVKSNTVSDTARDKKYDVIVIGAGISGLTAASLLAKRKLKVMVLEHADHPGGSCGIFKRKGATFDQGAAMLYGFGEHGFNAHRFLFNCLEEPFNVVKHDLLYVVHYNGKMIHFHADIDAFIDELSAAFPGERTAISRFYNTMHRLYNHVISETPSYTTPDETDPRQGLRSLLKHPFAYMRFLSYLNISAEKLLKKHFKDPELLGFFDKLTSTYCYATTSEAPAIMASVMFIDNHVGGSYYPAGSTLFLPGILEKVIEENGGAISYKSTVTQLLFEKHREAGHAKAQADALPCGIVLQSGEKLYGSHIIYSGTVWNLYKNLLPAEKVTEGERAWERAQLATYPSLVFYALVDASVIPPDACPIEMLAENPGSIDESEVTLYILSIDDHTLCQEGQHTVVAIGPTFRNWNENQEYETAKKEEIQRLEDLIENRFPGFKDAIIHCELATPSTIERYTMKNNGAVAGPKQMLGQHMLKRQSISTRWETLFCCGESTTMGTGTPTVTTSGIAAANAVLRKYGLEPYTWKPEMKNYVTVLKPPLEREQLPALYTPEKARLMALAGKCFFCNKPSCCEKDMLDVPGIMRRMACGNFKGADALVKKSPCHLTEEFIKSCEENCIQRDKHQEGVSINKILSSHLPVQR